MSGGQAQLIAILRAIYKNSPILVLDESTGSLDIEKENSIYKILKNIKEDKIIFMPRIEYAEHQKNNCGECDCKAGNMNGLFKKEKKSENYKIKRERNTEYAEYPLEETSYHIAELPRRIKLYGKKQEHADSDKYDSPYIVDHAAFSSGFRRLSGGSFTAPSFC